jgi:hypothetical protein
MSDMEESPMIDTTARSQYIWRFKYWKNLRIM